MCSCFFVFRRFSRLHIPSVSVRGVRDGSPVSVASAAVEVVAREEGMTSPSSTTSQARLITAGFQWDHVDETASHVAHRGGFNGSINVLKNSGLVSPRETKENNSVYHFQRKSLPVKTHG